MKLSEYTIIFFSLVESKQCDCHLLRHQLTKPYGIHQKVCSTLDSVFFTEVGKTWDFLTHTPRTTR